MFIDSVYSDTLVQYSLCLLFIQLNVVYIPVYTVKFCSITSAFADKIAQSTVQSLPSVILIIVV